MADAGEHILQRPAGGIVVVDVVGGQQGDVELFAESHDGFDLAGVAVAVEAADGQGEAIAEGIAEVEESLVL